MSSFKLSAEFGTAPVGAETIEWDWIENKDGYRERYEFTLIPDESVEVSLEWSSFSPETFLTLCEPLDQERVVRFTISAIGKLSLHASTWVRVSEAAAVVANFVKENS
jgi:hypothetical protein